MLGLFETETEPVFVIEKAPEEDDKGLFDELKEDLVELLIKALLVGVVEARLDSVGGNIFSYTINDSQPAFEINEPDP
jgi:hypothetical protein